MSRCSSSGASMLPPSGEETEGGEEEKEAEGFAEDEEEAEVDDAHSVRSRPTGESAKKKTVVSGPRYL